MDLTATIDHSVEPELAIRLLRQRLTDIPNVLADPAPEVDVLQLTQVGVVLCVRPCCATAHYSQVYFDTNRMIRDTFAAARFPVPVAHLSIQGVLPTM